MSDPNSSSKKKKLKIKKKKQSYEQNGNVESYMYSSHNESINSTQRFLNKQIAELKQNLNLSEVHRDVLERHVKEKSDQIKDVEKRMQDII